MRISYDADADAAYVMVADQIEEGAAVQQVHSIATPDGSGEIILDFDAEHRLLGIEILNAREVLPPSVIERAERSSAG